LLANGTTSTAATLTLGGAGQTNGSWGGTPSDATNKSSTFFGTTTTGILNVTTSTAPVSLSISGTTDHGSSCVGTAASYCHNHQLRN
jgi:hypothetical protein